MEYCEKNWNKDPWTSAIQFSVRKFIEFGADVNIKDAKGRTVLDHARDLLKTTNSENLGLMDIIKNADRVRREYLLRHPEIKKIGEKKTENDFKSENEALRAENETLKAENAVLKQMVRDMEAKQQKRADGIELDGKLKEINAINITINPRGGR